MLRWFTTNLRTFLLAFMLALAIWMTAVTAADPDETQAYPSPVPIEFIGLDPGLIMTGDAIPQQVDVTLRAPHSIWQKLLSNGMEVRAVVDLTSLGSGTHKVKIQMQVETRPVRVVSITPQTFEVALEPQSTKTLAVVFALTGNPAIGFQAGTPTLDPSQAIVSGAESLVSKVDLVQAGLDISNTRQNISAPVPLQAVDANGTIISGVTVMPDVVQVTVPVVQQGGYRDLAVKVMTVGNPLGGYSLISVAAFPPIVTVYSANSSIIESMPGYVETFPLDLNGAKADIEEQLAINLPHGVTLIGDQNVLVQVGIAPIESSRTISHRLVDHDRAGERVAGDALTPNSGRHPFRSSARIGCPSCQ